MDAEFLYRGVSKSFHREKGGLLKPKVQGPFTYSFHWNEGGLGWDSRTWASTSANAVIRHQLNQEGFPTSGISTTPHSQRAIVYSHGPSGTECGYVFKISRKALLSRGIEQFVVAKYCKPSAPEDDEVILLTPDGDHLSSEVIVEVIETTPLSYGVV